jgi:hypothetical protein
VPNGGTRHHQHGSDTMLSPHRRCAPALRGLRRSTGDDAAGHSQHVDPAPGKPGPLVGILGSSPRRWQRAAGGAMRHTLRERAVSVDAAVWAQTAERPFASVRHCKCCTHLCPWWEQWIVGGQEHLSPRRALPPIPASDAHPTFALCRLTQLGQNRTERAWKAITGLLRSPSW